MGPILPKPVTTKVLERRQNSLFRVGLASMNGFREKQEDAHAMVCNKTWGFFGVFDGHCGPLCSQFQARRFMESIKAAQTPVSDQFLTDLCLRLDKEFLQTQQEGGSTGTFMMAYGTSAGEKYRIQVGNVGDSRVIVGRQRGRQAHAMTEDHKPNNDGERTRIERAGGHVANNRVDGSLAVSRAFGDSGYKDGGKSERDYKVIAVPEITHYDCEPGDIVLLCCDGVFESDVFQTADVIQFIFDQLDESPQKDLAVVAASVCDAALERGSKDNISVMIVQLGGSFPDGYGPEEEVIPGPYCGPNAAISHQKFRDAYQSMCQTAHLTLAQCCDLRYERVRSQLEQRRQRVKCKDKTCDFATLSDAELRNVLSRNEEAVQDGTPRAELLSRLGKLAKQKGKDTRPVDVQDLEAELAVMSLPEDLQRLRQGDQRRLQYFEQWAEKKAGEASQAQFDAAADDPVTQKILELQRAGLPLPIILGLLAQQQRAGLGPPGGGGRGGGGRGS
eukprot:TRINITY_DN310_c0_g1_i1.p1 TRINITY_DN310_c0_g1~~TRINITY_DN310_c0_g1_i1.p1  ORF type:complete len:546 (+),score=150.52 TRINITY_DN310_c0_g1_i1:130-1638(+)